MGSLVLVDGSQFDWLGTGRPVFLRAIDDATSTVVALHFRPAEDLHGYLTLLRRVAAGAGLPLTLYGDRLGVFLLRNDAHWTLEEELQWPAQHPTQFGQVLQDLAISYIAAHSPQAKGRIERLWETLQDRLVAELRLRRIHTVEAAEADPPTYLADHTRRFAHGPPTPRPPGVGRRASSADRLSCRYTRRVARDNTVRLGPRLVQLPRGPHGRSYAGCRVELRECLDGDSSTIRAPASPRAGARHLRLAPPARATPTRRQELVGEGGPPSPLGSNGASSARAALAALAAHLRRPARPTPGRVRFPADNASVSSACGTSTKPVPSPHRGGHFHCTVKRTFLLDSDSAGALRGAASRATRQKPRPMIHSRSSAESQGFSPVNRSLHSR